MKADLDYQIAVEECLTCYQRCHQADRLNLATDKSRTPETQAIYTLASDNARREVRRILRDCANNDQVDVQKDVAEVLRICLDCQRNNAPRIYENLRLRARLKIK